MERQKTDPANIENTKKGGGMSDNRKTVQAEIDGGGRAGTDRRRAA